MTKLIAAWALAALLTAFLAYKVMAPQQLASAGETEFSLATVQIAIENKFETVDHLLADEFLAMDKADERWCFIALSGTAPLALPRARQSTFQRRARFIICAAGFLIGTMRGGPS